MKITPKHYEHMKAAMSARADLIPAMREQLATDPRVKNAEMRLRWDLFHDAGLTRWVCDNVYSYANDTHIDTALRSIMRDIEAAPAPEQAPEEDAPPAPGMR